MTLPPPRAPVAVVFTEPAFKTKSPENVFTAPKTNIPEPDFTKLKALPPSPITPPTFSDPEATLTVRLSVIVTAPPPVARVPGPKNEKSLDQVWGLEERVTRPVVETPSEPPLMLRVPVPKAASLFRNKVPPFRLAPPSKLLPTPVITTEPEPCFKRDPVPVNLTPISKLLTVRTLLLEMVPFKILPEMKLPLVID